MNSPLMKDVYYRDGERRGGISVFLLEMTETLFFKAV